MTTPARIIGRLCADLNTFGERIEACKAHAWYLDELMPPRGEQRDEFDALKHHLQWMLDAFCTLDEALVTAYREIDHLERVPESKPLHETAA